jgi:hypothetical protein
MSASQLDSAADRSAGGDFGKARAPCPARQAWNSSHHHGRLRGSVLPPDHIVTRCELVGQFTLD